ncbi:MAG: DUF305 domain-containing protein [Pyrinomonadaceae bacterium]
MKANLVTRSNFLAPLVLALLVLTGAACSTAPEKTTNANAAGSTGANAPAASPATTANHNAGDMNDTSGMDHSMMRSSPNAASQPYDLQFIDTMVAHHQGAVEMASAAETKARHAELKEFARKIVNDQEREIAEMRRLRRQWYAGTPLALNMEMPGMMDSMGGMDMNRMNAATGNDFDLMFIDMMTPHHTGAVVMSREALTKAEHPEIKQLAQQIITAQEREIAQMQKWKEAWR